MAVELGYGCVMPRPVLFGDQSSVGAGGRGRKWRWVGWGEWGVRLDVGGLVSLGLYCGVGMRVGSE